jgi:hypothetical protein
MEPQWSFDLLLSVLYLAVLFISLKVFCFKTGIAFNHVNPCLGDWEG